jgi:tRNA(Ile)-lysidine synthase TilS/MesJ
MDNLTRAFQVLDSRREMEPRALVGFSGGKDSLVCLDMAVKVYGVKNVVPFIMEFMPGLRITDEMTGPALKRYGFKEIKKYPAEAFFGNYKQGFYGWEGRDKQNIPNVSRKSIMKMIAIENKISTIIMGIKSCDSMLIRNAVKKTLCTAEACTRFMTGKQSTF